MENASIQVIFFIHNKLVLYVIHLFIIMQRYRYSISLVAAVNWSLLTLHFPFPTACLIVTVFIFPQTGQYESLDELEKDMDLCFQNAQTYNEPNSMLYKVFFTLKLL